MTRSICLTLVCFFSFQSFAHALVSEGRPGVPYFNHVLFLQKKVIQNGEVVAVSLAYADPGDERNLCRNSIDVFGGLELFREISERKWVLVDYELQSILIAEGFVGDADVFQVTECPNVETCLDWRETRNSSPDEKLRQATRPRAEKLRKVNFSEIQQRLETGRQLVKAARCRGCHSIEGFGAAYAPSLTWKRFKYELGWLEDFLASPYRMRPAMGDLMMLKYTSPNAQPNLQPQELKAVAGYLANVATASAPDDSFRRELWEEYDCYSCHAARYKEKPLSFHPTPVSEELQTQVQSNLTFKTCLSCHPFGNVQTVDLQSPGAANAFASDLLIAFEKLTLNYLAAFLKNPAYLEPQTRMPDPGLNKIQIEEVLNLARAVKEAIAAGTLEPIHIHYEMEPQLKR